MENINEYVFNLPHLNYNYSSIESDKIIIKPIIIRFPNYRLQDMLKSYCSPIHTKLIKFYLIITKYEIKQITRITSIIKAVQSGISVRVFLTEALPWYSLEIIKLEENIVYETNSIDSFIYNQVKRNIICDLFLNYLNFFDLAILQRVSSQFAEPIYNHLYRKYSLKKSELFVKFNLRKFLKNIDKGGFNLDAITIYELRFIFKHFGHHMREIIIQLEYIKMNMNLNDSIVKPIIDTITDIIEEFTDELILESVFIHKIKVKDKFMRKFYKFTNEKSNCSLVFAEDNITKLDKFDNFLEPLNCYDMQTNPNLINRLCFTNLVERKNVNNLKMLTAYPHLQVDRLFLIEFLNKIKLESFDIQGTNHITENQDCDDLINALLVNSRESLKSIKITSCRSVNIFRLINQFINLEELIITNLNIGDIYYATLLKLSKLRILKLPNISYLNDNICYEVYKNNKSLEYLDISKCHITGEFLEALNLEYDSGKLVIDITDTRAASLHSRDEIFITNEKLIIKNRTFKCYEDWEINEIVEQITYDSDTHLDDYLGFIPKNKLRKSFVKTIRLFLNYLKLYLSDYFHFDQNCINYISSFKILHNLYLCTYYPMIDNEQDIKILSNCKIERLVIIGYDKKDKGNPKNLSDFIFGGLNAKSNYLHCLEMGDCSIGCQFIDIINKYINLKELKLTTVHGFPLQDFEKLDLPQLKSLEICNSTEFNDDMCFHIVKKCPKLDKLKISKCKLFKGDCFGAIDCLPHQQRLLNIHVYRAPAVIKFMKKEIRVKKIAIEVGFNDCFYKFVSLYEEHLNPNVKKYFLDDIYSLDLKSHTEHIKQYNLCFDNDFFGKMHELRNLRFLTIESYYPFIDYNSLTLYKLNIDTLHILNDKICENDWSYDILKKFSIFNPNNLKIILLRNCKINEATILSINVLKNLNILAFESVEFENKDAVKQLYLEKLDELTITDTDMLTDDACNTIIRNHLNLQKLNLTKCRKITEQCFLELQSIGLIMKNELIIDINYTLAGYYSLFNELNLSKQNIKFNDKIHNANIFYLEQILLKKYNHKDLPCLLVQRFFSFNTLDLTNYMALDDSSFDYVSQLINLGAIRICSHYKNVQNRNRMINNLIKLNIKTLTIVGNDNSDCNDIIEKIADRKPNDLLEIILINCEITSELIENIQRFSNLQKLTISNDNRNYLNIIMEELNFNDSTIYQLTVNDEIIDNNLNSIEKLKKKLNLY